MNDENRTQRRARRKSRHLLPIALITGLIAAGTGLVTATPSQATDTCNLIVPSHNGWAVDMCQSDPSVPATMAVTVDGAPKGVAALIRVYHSTANGRTQPQVAVLYASGYVRLKQNADPPGSPIPFGASAVLGPALWRSPTDYWHNPTLTSLAISTQALQSYLYLAATGTNRDLDVNYSLAVTPPTNNRTTMFVTQQARARVAIPIDPGRAAEGQGAKTAAQVSTLHIPTGAPCDGGRQLCQDIDRVRFPAANGTVRAVKLDNVARPGFLLSSPAPLGGSWLDARHSTNIGWQGNTPSLRVCFDSLPTGRDYRVQGYAAATSDPNHDNIGVWIADQTRAHLGWQAGESETVIYRLVAQDDFSTVTPTAC